MMLHGSPKKPIHCTILIDLDNTRKVKNGNLAEDDDVINVFKLSLKTQDGKIIRNLHFPLKSKHYKITDICLLKSNEEHSLKPVASEMHTMQKRDIFNRLVRFFCVGENALRFSTFKVPGSHPFQPFDCQSYLSYLLLGATGSFPKKAGNVKQISKTKTQLDALLQLAAKENATPFTGYCLQAENSQNNECAIHYFFHLRNGVYISKLGNLEVVFSNYEELVKFYEIRKFETVTLLEFPLQSTHLGRYTSEAEMNQLISNGDERIEYRQKLMAFEDKHCNHLRDPISPISPDKRSRSPRKSPFKPRLLFSADSQGRSHSAKENKKNLSSSQKETIQKGLQQLLEGVLPTQQEAALALMEELVASKKLAYKKTLKYT